ncbi:hypothetical protein KIW84_043981 [Lathyrus oleraceus]|uniref:Uncharacterized protein n=1 Tax=Pisum sativum TaxID=3888 RepID=A0A9D4XGZ2_PEA|nr:hypothetical protein KIW84_043981 [Pisum sativum]
MSKMDPIKYVFEKSASTGRVARGQMMLNEYDIQYTSQKAIEGSVLPDYIALQPIEDYQPRKFEFPDEDISRKVEKGQREPENKGWREEELEAAGFAGLTQEVGIGRSRSREDHSRSGNLVSGHTRMALGNTRMRWSGTRMALGITRMDEEDDVLNVVWSLLVRVWGSGTRSIRV